MKPQSCSLKHGWLCALFLLCAARVPAQSHTVTPLCQPPGAAAQMLFTVIAFALTKAPHVFVKAPPCQQPVPTPTPPVIKPEHTPAPIIEAMPTEGRLAEFPAAEVMRLARMLYIRSRSSWFNAEKLERELLKRKEFGELGLEITRNGKRADLILEVTRKPLTTRFTCAFFEPSSERVVAGTTASSLGGEIEPHLAEAIVKQFKAARSKPAETEKKPE